MLLLQELSGSFADNDTRRHGVAGRYARQDRSVRYTKAFDTIDLEFAVDDGHGSRPIFAVPD